MDVLELVHLVSETSSFVGVDDNLEGEVPGIEAADLLSSVYNGEHLHLVFVSSQHSHQIVPAKSRLELALVIAILHQYLTVANLLTILFVLNTVVNMALGLNYFHHTVFLILHGAENELSCGFPHRHIYGLHNSLLQPNLGDVRYIVLAVILIVVGVVFVVRVGVILPLQPFNCDS